MSASSDAEKSKNASHSGGNQIVIGSWVYLELIEDCGDSERLSVRIVPDEEADFSSGLLAENTPLAQALLGKTADCVIPYQLGGIREIEIVVVEQMEYSPQDEVKSNRQAIIDRAVSKSNLADAVHFALTVDQKWGDTDPESLESNWE